MFGYVTPDKPYLYLKDDTLYNSLYCGLCKSIGKGCGQFCRFALNYDLTFASALMHNILGEDVKIERKHCIAHWFKKRPIQKPDEISLKLGALNVILAYYKLLDDKIDEKKGNFKSFLFKKGYKKAKKQYPNFDKTVKEGCQNLYKLEKENSNSIDFVSDCFAEMLKNVSIQILENKSTESTQNLFYGLGKWIYLIDALDDYDKDSKSGNFNVFRNAYGSKNYESLIKDHANEIGFVFQTVFMLINENYPNIKTEFNTDLVKNVLFRGIPKKTAEIINKGNKKQ